MIIVSELTNGNEIRFIPRKSDQLSFVLIDETTGSEFNDALSFTRDGYYVVCTLNNELVDNRRYIIKIYNTDSLGVVELVYNDIIFCSTQDIKDYSINNNEFDYSDAPLDYDNNDSSKTKYTII